MNCCAPRLERKPESGSRFKHQDRPTPSWCGRALETSTRETPFEPNAFSRFPSSAMANGLLRLVTMALIVQPKDPPGLRAFSTEM